MLKFTYTETSVHLEQIAHSLEEWIALRVVLSVRAGQRIIIERSNASILLPTNLVELHALEITAVQETSDLVELVVADKDYVEVNLKGVWLSSHQDEVGVFVAALTHRTEFVLVKLWHETQACAPSLS